jgi:hypothetical protein
MLLLAIIVSGSGATRWSAAPPAAVASGRCLRRHDYFSQISCWTLKKKYLPIDPSIQCQFIPGHYNLYINISS